MLTDKHTLMHVARASITTEERKKDEKAPVFVVGLTLEPLTYEQAKQLGPDILAHCFTSQKAIRGEMRKIDLKLSDKEQAVTVSMAVDAEPHCTLRHVRIPSVSIACRTEPNAGATKAKKVSPQQPTLRATFKCLVDAADHHARDLFCGFIHDSFFFTFDQEERDLFAGVHTDPDDVDEDDGQDELPIETRPPADADAGDVLDEQPKRGRRKPRLVKANGADAGATAEA